jgi:protein transport protein SEC61 subunit gamma-like protein
MGLRNVIERIRRILLVSSKPDKAEYKQSLKITGLGFVVIGVVGFVIFLIAQLLNMALPGVL